MARSLNPPRRPRDENGWRIPKPNTLSWQIYVLTQRGMGVRPIARMFRRSRGTIKRMLQGIKGIPRK